MAEHKSGFNADKISFDLTAVSNFFEHRRIDIQRKIYPDSINPTNGYIISYLCENIGRDIYQKDIEKEFDLSRSTVSTILKEFEKDGLIERKSVYIDARLKKVVPTQAAQIINEACSKELTRFFFDLASDLKDSEVEAFQKVLEVMKKNSDRIRNTDDTLF